MQIVYRLGWIAVALWPAVAFAGDFKPQPAGSISTADANAASLAAARATVAVTNVITVSPTVQQQQQQQQQLQAQQQGGGGGGTGTAAQNVIDQRRAPDVIPPSIAGGGFDCPVVGLSPGASAIGGGGAVGISWISPDCNTRKLAELLDKLGYPQAAAILLQRHFTEVADALAASGGH